MRLIDDSREVLFFGQPVRYATTRFGHNRGPRAGEERSAPVSLAPIHTVGEFNAGE